MEDWQLASQNGASAPLEALVAAAVEVCARLGRL